MKFLVIAAHADDEILGCGGTSNLLSRTGQAPSTDYLIFSSRDNPIDERFREMPLLYFIDKIEKLIKKEKYDLVFTHYPHDLNQDHQVVSEATMIACRPTVTQCEILAYEIPSSTELASVPFIPTVFYRLQPCDMEYKLETLEKKYTAELCQYPHPRSLRNVTYLASFRGSQCGTEYAEGFVNLRSIR